MKNNCNDLVFRKYSGNWIHPLLLGFGILLLSYLIDHHLYYIHIYLFVVSAIIIAASYQTFSVLKKDKIHIYFGRPYSRKFIELYLPDIQNIEIRKEQIRVGFISGGLPIVTSEKVDRLLIALKKPLDATVIDLLKKDGSFLPKQIRVGENGNELFVISKPAIGYKKFLEYVTNRLSLPLADLDEGKNKIRAC
jgi:hypothetical protein